MKSVLLLIPILVLFILAPIQGNAYSYKFAGAWAEFNNNTEADLARGLNGWYSLALNYAHANYLYSYLAAINLLDETIWCQGNCDNDTFCTSFEYYVNDTYRFCIGKHNDEPYITALQSIIPRPSNQNLTFDECASYCDNNPNCNLFEFWLGDITANYGPACYLFQQFTNSTLEETISIDPNCTSNCSDAFYVRGNMCRSINAAVPDSYCNTYCEFNDTDYPNLCTSVVQFMRSICECNNIAYGSDYCFSRQSNIPDSYCQSYCHVNGTTCSVDGHMQGICGCAI